MKMVVKKFTNFKEAEEWNIKQYLKMSPEERQKIARKLRERVYGKNPPDVRDAKK